MHIVMELCGGGELFDSIVESGNFSERKAAQVFRKMVQVVHHCQELGVMHRDLKPENFLLTSKDANGELKLTDFGLGVFFKPGERFRDLVGSPYYVAPEVSRPPAPALGNQRLAFGILPPRLTNSTHSAQVLRKNYSHEADMWSLGVILYILLSGLPPFWGDTEEQIFKMVLKGHIDFKTDPWPKISEAAKDCVRKLLQQDVTQRATAQDILKHDWLVKEGAAHDVNLDHVVLGRMKQFAQMNKLKKVCLMVVGQHLSADEITGEQRVVPSQAYDGACFFRRRAWCTRAMDAIKNSCPVHLLLHLSAAGMKELFKSIDADNSGTITVAEMRKAMSQWGHKISEAELQDLMRIADVDGDGLIDYNEVNIIYIAEA